MSKLDVTRAYVRELSNKTKDMTEADRVEYTARSIEGLIDAIQERPKRHAQEALRLLETAARACVKDVTTERLGALRGALLVLDDARERDGQ